MKPILYQREKKARMSNQRHYPAIAPMQLAPLYPVLYRVLNPLFPACLWAGQSTHPVVALTFDDGPHPDYTPPLLDVLERYQVTASFFVLGQRVDRYPDLTQQIYQRGHWLGLHGYRHEGFPWLSAQALRQSLTDTQRAIAHACGLEPTVVHQQVRDVRPPNGLFTPKTLSDLERWHYRPVMWSVVPEDWLEPGVDVVLDRVLQQVQNGSHIVLHDGYYGGRDVAATVERLIPALVARNFRFVTIDDLWQQMAIAS
ncbi:MAG: polysaccharide deacetylase family protein [Synechococcales bacterium]|nr:polysaccharide deacetylase family protein [Synechococcales bacterium]